MRAPIRIADLIVHLTRLGLCGFLCEGPEVDMIISKGCLAVPVPEFRLSSWALYVLESGGRGPGGRRDRGRSAARARSGVQDSQGSVVAAIRADRLLR